MGREWGRGNREELEQGYYQNRLYEILKQLIEKNACIEFKGHKLWSL